MNPIRIRPLSARQCPDPDAPAPPPAWLAAARVRLSDLVASVGMRGPTVDSCITLLSILATVEIDGLPHPDVREADGAGGVMATFDVAPDRAVVVACRGRSVEVTARTFLRPAPEAFAAIDQFGEDVEVGADRPVARLRTALAWMAGYRGVPEWEVKREAANSRKLI